MRDLTHSRKIFGSLVENEQNLFGEEHFSSGKCIWTGQILIWIVTVHQDNPLSHL